MKRPLKLFSIAMIAMFAMSACRTTVVVSTSHSTTTNSASAPVALTGSDAVDWTIAHMDSLVDVVMATTGNTRNPDDTREVYRTIGYDGLNVPYYGDAENLLDSVVLCRLIDKAKAKGLKSAVMLSGNSGAGKTSALKQNPQLFDLVKNAGIVLDETFAKKKKFDAMVKRLKQEGFTDITVIQVYNTPLQSFKNIASRYLHNGRAIGYNYLMNAYPNLEGRVKDLEENYQDLRRVYINNANNSSDTSPTHGLCTPEEAMKWSYIIDKETAHEMLDFIYHFCDEHNLPMRDTYCFLYNR